MIDDWTPQSVNQSSIRNQQSAIINSLRSIPMTYYGGKDLAAAFRTVRANTIKIAEEIPEDKYTFRAAPDTRSVAQMLAHPGVSTRFQRHVHVNKVTDMTTGNFGARF